MNSKLYMVALFGAVLIVNLTSCGYDSFEQLDVVCQTDMTANADLCYLRDNYYGNNYLINEDLIFSGVVVSSDRSGNFYKSFIVQDDTGAVEVYAGMYDLHTIYHLGGRVFISSRGLSAGCYNGVIRLGLATDLWSNYNVDSFGTRAVIDQYVFRSGDIETVMPIALTADKLDESYCGWLVSIDDLNLDDKIATTWASGDLFGSYVSRLFVMSNGEKIAVYTSSYANFADQTIPLSKMKITGILMYGNFGGTKRFALKIRDLNDVEIR